MQKGAVAEYVDIESRSASTRWWVARFGNERWVGVAGIPRVVRGNEGSRKGFIKEIPRRRTEECPFFWLQYEITDCGTENAVRGSGLGSVDFV